MISRNFKIRKNCRWDKYEVRGYIFIFFIWDELRLFQEDHKISKGELVLLNACNWKFLSILRWHPTTGCFPQDNSSQNWETEVKIHTCPLCVCVCVCISCPGMSDSLGLHGLQPARLLCPWNSPGKNIGVGCHNHLQAIFLTQGLNPGLLH